MRPLTPASLLLVPRAWPRARGRDAHSATPAEAIGLESLWMWPAALVQRGIFPSNDEGSQAPQLRQGKLPKSKRRQKLLHRIETDGARIQWRRTRGKPPQRGSRNHRSPREKQGPSGQCRGRCGCISNRRISRLQCCAGHRLRRNPRHPRVSSREGGNLSPTQSDPRSRTSRPPPVARPRACGCGASRRRFPRGTARSCASTSSGSPPRACLSFARSLPHPRGPLPRAPRPTAPTTARRRRTRRRPRRRSCCRRCRASPLRLPARLDPPARARPRNRSSRSSRRSRAHQ